MRQFAISTGHPKTTGAARVILSDGGNAIDAAIAAFAMSWVAEPCMSSAGGGAFAMVYYQGENPRLFDFFCQTPRNNNINPSIDFYPVTVNFGDTTEVFHVGKASIAVPGSVAGIFALHEAFGTIPLTVLFKPAILAAKKDFF